MGMVDRGADIGFLSQFPGEQEILYGPLMGMEVRGTRVDGSTLVIEVDLSTNQKSLTLEQVGATMITRCVAFALRVRIFTVGTLVASHQARA